MASQGNQAQDHGGDRVPDRPFAGYSASYAYSTHSQDHGGDRVPQQVSPGFVTNEQARSYSGGYQQPLASDPYATSQHTQSYVAAERGQGPGSSQDALVSPPQAHHLRGYRHIFDDNTTFRPFRFPHHISLPTHEIAPDTQNPELLRNYDILGRSFVRDRKSERYISQFDGKFKNLVIQASDSVYSSQSERTWRRTFIRNYAPFYLRISNWAYRDLSSDKHDKNWPLIVGRWAAASAVLSFCVGFQIPVSAGELRNEGKYDYFPYSCDYAPKVARNHLENPSHALSRGKRSGQAGDKGDAQSNSESYDLFAAAQRSNRLLQPTYLCMLKNPTSETLDGWDRVSVDSLLENGQAPPKYMFVSYSTQQFSSTSREDDQDLWYIAEAAARRYEFPAFWIATSCMPCHDGSLFTTDGRPMREEVYKISDIIRGAAATIIIVGPDPVNPHSTPTLKHMLKQWGSRVWCFPELLLSKEGVEIPIYERGNPDEPLVLTKSQFPEYVWGNTSSSSNGVADGIVARQLIDHYEGTLILTQLELVTLALKCLYNRKLGKFLSGDESYALMGLTRLRPLIDPTDTSFQAFARLSLANDSDSLLERLICVLPKNNEQDWHAMDDAYGASLWDIYPDTQVSGIADGNTVIIDGLRAANVRWKSFWPVYVTGFDSWRRKVAGWCLHTGGYLFYIGILVAAIASQNSTALGIGILLIIWSIMWLGMSPWLIRVLYGGKFWGQQPWLFGFEGYMDIATIEHQIFGSEAKLKWSCFGSPLSKFAIKDGHYVGLDPFVYNPVAQHKITNSLHAKNGDMRIFTLIDTSTMEVILFEAVRPPVAFVLGGSEGGMQRAIGVSHDWSTSTLYRETVLRMPTPLKEMMAPIPRAKLGLRRDADNLMPFNSDGQKINIRRPSGAKEKSRGQMNVDVNREMNGYGSNQASVNGAGYAGGKTAEHSTAYVGT